MPKLNKQTLDALPLAGIGAKANQAQYIVRDTELKGFFVVVGKKTITFTVQVERYENGKRVQTRREKIGTYPDMTADEARRRARSVMETIRAEKPTEETDAAPALTLGAAWAAYRETFVRLIEQGKKSTATLANYDRAYQHLADWADVPLADLSADKARVERRFRDVTDGKGIADHLRGGPGAGNLILAFLSVVYNYAVDRVPGGEDLPAYVPGRAISKWEKNHLPRRQRALSARDLRRWNAQRLALPPLRAEFHLLNLLTGSRQEQLRSLLWDDVSFEDRSIHFPRPKGGTERAYSVPMTEAMAECLRRCRIAGGMIDPSTARDYVFPADRSRSRGRKDGGDPSPHMTDHSEDRADLSHWGSDLRRTYKTLAKEAGVSEFVIDLFQNHAQGTVSRGYHVAAAQDRDWLLGEQQKITDYMCRHLGELAAPALTPANN